MDKARLGNLVWWLIYGGLLTVCVSVFVLRADGDSDGLGWLMLAAGTVATVAGAALVVVRARMENPTAAKKEPRP